MFVFCQFWDPSVYPFRAVITSLWFYNGSCTRDLYLRFDRMKKKRRFAFPVRSTFPSLYVSSLLLLGSLYLRVRARACLFTYVLRRYFVCSREVCVRFIIANTEQRRRSLTALSLPRGISCVHLFHARRNIETRKRIFSFFSLFSSQFLFFSILLLPCYSFFLSSPFLSYILYIYIFLFLYFLRESNVRMYANSRKSL